MNYRNYYTIFKNEPDVLTVPDVARLLQIGKNTVYKFVKEGRIGSIKQGKKIIVPKTCLVEFLADERNYQILSPTAPIRRKKCWTSKEGCGSVCVAREDKEKSNKKGA